MYNLVYRFCKRHRIKSSSEVPSVPKDLLIMSELVLPQFIFCLIQYLREGYSEPGMVNITRGGEWGWSKGEELRHKRKISIPSATEVVHFIRGSPDHFVFKVSAFSNLL